MYCTILILGILRGFCSDESRPLIPNPPASISPNTPVNPRQFRLVTSQQIAHSDEESPKRKPVLQRSPAAVEVQSLISDSRSLSAQIQEHQEQFNVLNEKYEKNRKVISALIRDLCQRPKWRHHNQTMDTVVPLFDEMSGIRTRIMALNEVMARSVLNKNALDERIEGVIWRLFESQHYSERQNTSPRSLSRRRRQMTKFIK